MTHVLRHAVPQCLQKVRQIKNLLHQPEGRQILSNGDKRRAEVDLAECETTLQILDGEISNDNEDQESSQGSLANHLNIILNDLKSVDNIIRVCVDSSLPLPHNVPGVRDSLEEELRNLIEDIGTVQRLRPSRIPNGPSPNLRGLLSRHGKLEEHFTESLKALILPLIGGQPLLHKNIGAIKPLWSELPPIHNPVGEEIGSSKWINDNPQNDGYVIKADTIQMARTVLRILCNAWLSIPDQSSNPQVRATLMRLRRMPKIVLTLKSMRGSRWIDYFLHSEIDDDSFPLSEAMLKSTVFPETCAADAERFYAEQRRIQPRTWGDQRFFQLSPKEPLPYHRDHHRGKGGFSDVYIVRNAFDDKQYVLKVTKDSGGPRAHDHLRNDAEHLQEICDDCRQEHIPHIVRLVNTFSRGHQFGLVITPAADCNLEQLLFNSAQDPEALRFLKPSLLKAIGCLCRTLVYIHEVKSKRHRDIKPQNILFQRISSDGNSNFLWSDFGLAKQLATDANAHSATYSDFQGTIQYAAPEQLDNDVAHGRSADVFSFGCIMFEIVGSMLYQEYSRDANGFPRRLQNYKDKINMLHQGIDALITEERRKSHPHLAAIHDIFQGAGNQHRRHHSSSDAEPPSGPSLTPLLKLIKKMTCAEPTKRPKAMDVVRTLFDMRTEGLELFCPECFDAVQCNKAGPFSGRRKRWYEL